MTLQVLPSPVIWPWTMATPVASTPTTAGTLNDDTDEYAVLFSFPKSGTLTDLGITVAATNTQDLSVPFRLETVGTDGNPSGTLYDAAGTGNFSFATADDDVFDVAQVNSGTGITVTAGHQCFLRWKRTGGGGTLSMNARYAYGTVSLSTNPRFSDYNITAGTTWTKIQAVPMIALNIGGWVAPPHCLGGLITTATEAFQSPAQLGLLINLPISIRVLGVVAQHFSGSSNTFTYNLYSDPTGSPVERAVTPTIDTDTSTSAASSRSQTCYFTTPYTIAANTDYVLAVTPLTAATDLTILYWTGNDTYAAAYPGGSASVKYARADSSSGAFSPTTTRIPWIGLIYDAVDSGSTKPPFIIGG